MKRAEKTIILVLAAIAGSCAVSGLIKKQNIFSKLREIIANKRENSKYIDNSIVAQDIAKVHEEKSKKEKFKSGIEVGDTSNIEVTEQKNIQTVEQKDKVPTGIGG